MTYEKNIWQRGDTITAEKLNHLEGGGLRQPQL